MERNGYFARENLLLRLFSNRYMRISLSVRAFTSAEDEWFFRAQMSSCALIRTSWLDLDLSPESFGRSVLG